MMLMTLLPRPQDMLKLDEDLFLKIDMFIFHYLEKKENSKCFSKKKKKVYPRVGIKRIHKKLQDQTCIIFIFLTHGELCIDPIIQVRDNQSASLFFKLHLGSWTYSCERPGAVLLKVWSTKLCLSTWRKVQKLRHDTHCYQGCGTLSPTFLVGMQNHTATLQNRMAVSYKVKKLCTLTTHPSTLTVKQLLKRTNMCPHKDLCVAGLLTVARNRKQPKSLSASKRINKRRYKHIIRYYT